MLTAEERYMIETVIRLYPRKVADLLEREDAEAFRDICEELREYAKEKEREEFQ